MKKNIIIVVVSLIVLAAYLLLPARIQDSVSNNGKEVSDEQTTPQLGVPAPGFEGVTEMIVKPNGSNKYLVTYTDNGYSPNSLEVNVGTEVTFFNESSNSVWPASSKHPTHRDYPTTGGCIGSTFDACKWIGAVESWSFKFDVKGKWFYHNHLTPNHFGSITVK